MALLEFFAAHRNAFLTIISELGRYMGEEVLALLIVCFFCWCADRRIAYQIGFSFFYSGCGIQEIKILCRVPRPWILNPSLVPLESAVPSATGYSFPSGHTQTVTSIMGSLACNTKRRWLQAILVCLFILTGWSRMYAGVHTPADVFTAMAIGIVVVVLVNIFVRPFIYEDKPAGILCIVTIIIGLIGVVTSLIMCGTGMVDLDNSSDLAKTAGSCMAYAVCFYWDKEKLHIVNSGKKWQRALKLVVGLLILLGIRAALKSLVLYIGDITDPLGAASDIIELIGHALRYFIMLVLALNVFPVVWDKVVAKLEKKETNAA